MSVMNCLVLLVEDDDLLERYSRQEDPWHHSLLNESPILGFYHVETISRRRLDDWFPRNDTAQLGGKMGILTPPRLLSATTKNKIYPSIPPVAAQTFTHASIHSSIHLPSPPLRFSPQSPNKLPEILTGDGRSACSTAPDLSPTLFASTSTSLLRSLSACMQTDAQHTRTRARTHDRSPRARSLARLRRRRAMRPHRLGRVGGCMGDCFSVGRCGGVGDGVGMRGRQGIRLDCVCVCVCDGAWL
jgi:hypothetical protein